MRRAALPGLPGSPGLCKGARGGDGRVRGEVVPARRAAAEGSLFESRCLSGGRVRGEVAQALRAAAERWGGARGSGEGVRGNVKPGCFDFCSTDVSLPVLICALPALFNPGTPHRDHTTTKMDYWTCRWV
jgi:hypothetical protein